MVKNKIKEAATQASTNVFDAVSYSEIVIVRNEREIEREMRETLNFYLTFFTLFFSEPKKGKKF